MAPDEQFASMERPLVLYMWTPPSYVVHLHDVLSGYDMDKQIVRLVGLSEHVIGSLISFIYTYRNGCLFSLIDDFWAYNIAEGGPWKHWKALGRLVLLPKELVDPIGA